MRRVIRTVVIAAVLAGTLSPVAFGTTASAAPDEETEADDAIPDEALEAPADLTDDTDGDGDGLTDAEERSGARNPWPSGFVGMAAPGDPTDAADPDSDDDGLSDGTEVGTVDGNRAGTASDPNDADTDDDGVDDGAEVAAGTDPRAADSDNDEVDDGAEQEAATNPTAADSDFDGADDGAELAAGRDPVVSDTTGIEVGGPFHFTDVPAGVYYEDGAYWATSNRVGALKRAPQFKPDVEVKRWKLAQILRNYAGYLGRDIAAPPHSFSDIGTLRPQGRAGVSWAASNGIIPPTTAGTFTPGRTVSRAQLATALYRFAVWAGHDAALAPADNPYTDTATQSATTRGAIGWLAQQGVVQSSGVVPSPTTFGPRRLVTRAHAVAFLFELDRVIGTPTPTGDTDGDGISNLDELQGFQNPYPEPVDGGDVDPLDPEGVCLSPDVPGDLPPTAAGPGASTDPADADSDDDGMSDGREITALQTDPNDADTDNDCVTDGDEVIGWNVVVDFSGQGCPGDGVCPDITRDVSVADPLDVDSDDDDLADHEERLLRTYAQQADSDNDGLDDYQEWNRWFTSPTTVDSDSDAQGSEADQPPTPSLFDGLELRDTGTSPSVADTDGDGTTDFDEFDSPTRDQLLAELPGFEMELAGGTSVRLVKERSQDEGGALEVGLTDSVSNATSSSTSSSVTQSETNAVSVEVGMEFAIEIGTETTTTETYSVSLGYSHEWGTERTREFSQEESTEIGRERSVTESEEWTSSEAAVSGEISQGMRFRNTGRFAYELSNVGYTLFLRNPETLEEEVVGTMTVPLDGIVLGPGASTEPIQVVAEDVNVDLIEQFLASPSSLRFSTGNLEFLDSEGRNLEFVQESTFGQTAQIVIDFGAENPDAEGRYEEYNVSTNVTRDEIGGEFNDISAFPGVRVGSPAPGALAYEQGVLDQIGYPRCEDDNPGEGCYTTTPDGALESIDGLANISVADAGADECPSIWTVMTSTDEQTETARTEGVDDVVVHAGERLRLVRQTDCDKDGLVDSLEAMVNAEVGSADTDEDGLTDLEEAEGWIVGLPDPANAGAPCAADPGGTGPLWNNDSDACPWTSADPKVADADLDGVEDPEERDGAGRAFSATALDERANPRELDSDGDRLADCLPSGFPDECGGLGSDPAPLHSSVRYVDPTPCATPGCWVNPQADLGTALDIAGPNSNADPRDDVRSIWVAGGTYTAPLTGFELPSQAGVLGGFRGDERRLEDRTIATTGPTATRLVGQGVAQQDAVVRVDGDFTTLDGVVVQGGGRGGIRGTGDSATLRDLEVSNNTHPDSTVALGGGGISWNGGEGVLVRRATVSSNQGPAGGLFLDGVDDVRVEDSAIRNNYSDGALQATDCASAPARFCFGGGGALVRNSVVAFDDSRIEDNTALVGGGIDALGAGTVLRVRNSRVTGNTAQGNAFVVGRGGGIHAHALADVLLSNCLVAENLTRVGPRWVNANADGFGGGLFAHDLADVRMINCTFSGNDGAGAIVAGSEMTQFSTGPGGFSTGSTGLAMGATAVAQNSIFVGNTMDWQPTYTERLTGLLGSQGRPTSFSQYESVANGVLGFNDEWNSGGDVTKYNECLGGNAGALTPFDDNNCAFLWFTGIAAASSTDLRGGGSPESVVFNGPSITTEDSMVGTDSTHGTFGDFCAELEYFGRTESSTTSNARGSVTCDGGSKTDRYLGLRGRGFQGRAVRSLAVPASIDDLFSFPDYELAAGTNAVNRGNQDVDWDPFLAGIQDPPETDLAGNPRLVGRRIDLGPFELQ